MAVNSEKRRAFDCRRMQEAMERALADSGIRNCEVSIYDGLIAEYTKHHGIGYMVRRLRNNMDYNYEENIAEVNKLIDPSLEYVYFRADNVAVSSSMGQEAAPLRAGCLELCPARHRPPCWRMEIRSAEDLQRLL